ncbi:MAG TPA: YafY family protein [Pyrinomonadaceae bacterium]|nr:YafY family protein [Pyrinomonadaceae bacterium]
MRADRLLSIMLLLQIYRRLTAAELARRLEVSERTIQRDMDALSTAGVPVVAERGAGGGWALVEGYHTNLTGLNGAEIQSLFAATPSGLLSDLSLDKAADAAHVKLLASLPAASRALAEYARQRIHVDSVGWGNNGERATHLRTIQEAVWQGRKLFVAYARACEQPDAELLVDPLGLVAKGGVWYLVASVGGDVRSYRVSRVRAARLSEEEASRPEGFDLALFWAESVARFKTEMPRYFATFRAHKSVLPVLYYAGRFSRVEEASEPDAEGWAVVRMRFQFEEDACGLALGFGTKVELLEPEGLRAKVSEMAAGVVEFYEGRGARA